MSDMEHWLRAREITEVGCLVCDLDGIARGKILPAAKLIRALADDALRLPEAVLVQTAIGHGACQRAVSSGQREHLLLNV